MTINIPNILTLIRILLTPLFVIFLLNDLFSFALLVFSIAAITDGLDGILARYFRQTTTLGAYLDPIADKLLLASAFVGLAVLKILPAWLAVIVLTRDILIVTGIAVFAMSGISIDMNPSFISRCTTVLQVLTVFLAMINLEISWIDTVKWILIWATAGFTITSGLHYIYFGLNLIQNASADESKSEKN